MLILNFNVDMNVECVMFFFLLFVFSSYSDKCLNIDLNIQSRDDNKIHLKRGDAHSTIQRWLKTIDEE